MSSTRTRRANRVQLRGRLSRAPEDRTLPSGDRLVLLRVMVERPDGSREDSIPVAVGPTRPRSRGRRGRASSPTVRRAAELAVGDEVAVDGWIERRFWEADGRRRSRLQVVAEELDG